VFDLTGGELFVLCFLVLAVVSWPLWPRMGEAVFTLFAGPDNEKESKPKGGSPPGSEKRS
jgi:hypothetical protein